MRTTTTLLLSNALVSLVSGQAPGDTLPMTFEDAGGLLQLDTIYPAGCWQVGSPNKPVFTSAYSEPNALVTDTLLPHAATSTCYAEFSTTVDDNGYYGKWLSFRHRMDMDSSQSFGWVEIQAPFDTVWYRAGDWSNWFLYMTEFSGDGVATDTGVVFTGSNAGWTGVGISLDCLSVLFGENTDRGGGSPVLRYRFVFQGDANTGARDGWMIDDVRVASRVCLGRVKENADEQLVVYPVPTSGHITLDWGRIGRESGDLRVIDTRGTVVHKSAGPAAVNRELDVRDLPPGAYAVLVRVGEHCAAARFCVQR